MLSIQNILVAVILAWAAALLVRSIIRGAKGSCGDGSCGCGTRSNLPDERLGTRRELIQLGTPAGPTKPPAETPAAHPDR